MRNLNSKVYQDTIQRLERMSDGIAQHNQETNFPPTLTETERRKRREELENIRTEYESKQRAADLAYDKYNQLLKDAVEQLSKDDSMLRGFYGKDNAILGNFGTNVISRSRAPRKAKTTEDNSPSN